MLDNILPSRDLPYEKLRRPLVFKTQGNVLVLLKSEQKSIQDILLFDFPTCLRKSFLVVFLMNLLLNAFSGVSWIIEKGFLPIAEDAEQLEQIGTLIPTSRKINETHFREFKTRGLGAVCQKSLSADRNRTLKNSGLYK